MTNLLKIVKYMKIKVENNCHNFFHLFDIIAMYINLSINPLSTLFTTQYIQYR